MFGRQPQRVWRVSAACLMVSTARLDGTRNVSLGVSQRAFEGPAAHFPLILNKVLELVQEEAHKILEILATYFRCYMRQFFRVPAGCRLVSLGRRLGARRKELCAEKGGIGHMRSLTKWVTCSWEPEKREHRTSYLLGVRKNFGQTKRTENLFFGRQLGENKGGTLNPKRVSSCLFRTCPI